MKRFGLCLAVFLCAVCWSSAGEPFRWRGLMAFCSATEVVSQMTPGEQAALSVGDDGNWYFHCRETQIVTCLTMEGGKMVGWESVLGDRVLNLREQLAAAYKISVECYGKPEFGETEIEKALASPKCNDRKWVVDNVGEAVAGWRDALGMTYSIGVISLKNGVYVVLRYQFVYVPPAVEGDSNKAGRL